MIFYADLNHPYSNDGLVEAPLKMPLESYSVGR